MEEAYAQLYLEFVRLRTLCLRQASLLRQLTAALTQQKGEANGALKDVPTTLGQLNSENPTYLNIAPPPPPSHLPLILAPSGLCGIQGPRNSGNFSDVLTQDLLKLSLETTATQRQDPKSELSVPHSLTSQMTMFRRDNTVSTSQPLSHQGDGIRLPAPSCPLVCSDALPQSSEALVSDVALQSHVCEFCQAVFPGDTTTRGQYLQHLYTHIT